MTTKPQTLLPLPDPPEREPDDMTSVQHVGENGNLHHLAQYLGNQETTIVPGERYIIDEPGPPPTSASIPTCWCPSTPTRASAARTTVTSSPVKASRRT